MLALMAPCFQFLASSYSIDANMSSIKLNFTCPGSPVSCECQGLITLIWTITFSATGSSVLDDPQGIEFTVDDSIGSSSSNNGFIGVLSNISGSSFESTLTSKLYFSFSASITVNCRDNFVGRGTLSLQGAGILLSADVFYVWNSTSGVLCQGTCWIALKLAKPNMYVHWQPVCNDCETGRVSSKEGGAWEAPPPPPPPPPPN